MRRRYPLLLGAFALGVAAIVGSMFAEPVVAQVRAALVKDVDNGARQPFGASASPVFAASTITASGDFLTVPAGKRAVVEHFSCINYASTTNSFVRLELSFVTAGVSTWHQFVAANAGPSLISGIDIWTVSQPLKAYADPGTVINLSAIRRNTASAGLECYITGHYVDLTP